MKTGLNLTIFLSCNYKMKFLIPVDLSIAQLMAFCKETEASHVMYHKTERGLSSFFDKLLGQTILLIWSSRGISELCEALLFLKVDDFSDRQIMQNWAIS